MSPITLRPIRPEDDADLERVLVQVLAEFGATGEGFSDQDAELSAMSQAYGGPGAAYFVALRDRRLVGGAGVGPLPGAEAHTCELRKMYLLPSARGLGAGRRLVETCLEEARRLGYRKCYLETLAQTSALLAGCVVVQLALAGAFSGATISAGCLLTY